MTPEEMIDDYFATEWAMTPAQAWAAKHCQDSYRILEIPEWVMFELFPAQEQVEGHPSEDTTNRWPIDNVLRRKFGCKIERRKSGREAVWSHPDLGLQTESDMAKLLGVTKNLRGGLSK